MTVSSKLCSEYKKNLEFTDVKNRIAVTRPMVLGLERLENHGWDIYYYFLDKVLCSPHRHSTYYIGKDYPELSNNLASNSLIVEL